VRSPVQASAPPVQASPPPVQAPPASEEFDGTGFFVERTRVLTNYHVIDGCEAVTLSTPGMPPRSGRVAATDPKNDLALIQVGTGIEAYPSVIPGLRSRVQLGETVFAYGYPLPGLLSSTGNFTSGLISSLAGIGNDINRMQISTPVQPGNSGGPLLDIYGNVIGVVVGKLNAGRVSQITDDIPQKSTSRSRQVLQSASLRQTACPFRCRPAPYNPFNQPRWPKGRDSSRFK
jgi:serine protease Do